MTDAKISELPAASVSAGANELAINEAGTSKKLTVTQIITLIDSATQTLLNKTIDADGTGNSITNIDDGNIKAGAAIDATKIADGSVTSTEFQYINTLSSNAQTQLTERLALSGGTMSGALNMGAQNLTNVFFIGFTAADTITISGDAIVVTQSFSAIDTEAAAATDNVDTITSGANNGRLYFYRSVNASRDPTFVDGTSFPMAGNFTLTNNSDRITFFGGSPTTMAGELCRSDNG